MLLHFANNNNLAEAKVEKLLPLHELFRTRYHQLSIFNEFFFSYMK